MKLPNQNCTSFLNGKCLHQAAPRRMLGTADCILNWPNSDARVMIQCVLQTRHPRPMNPPSMTKTPNAKVSGAGTASAGLPGYTAFEKDTE